MMNRETIDDMLMKHLTDSLSPDEQKEFDVWLNESADHRKMLDGLKQVWNNSDMDSFPLPDVNAEWNKLSDTINRKPKTRLSVWQISVAASLLIIALSSIIFFSSHQTTFTTGEGQYLIVNLPDSSTVRLNENSSLSYDENRFNKTDRILNLTGEAFFDAEHLENKPFTVFTDNASVTVLGTKFNLNATSSRNELVVTEGRVAFTSLKTSQSVIVVRGMKSQLTDESTPSIPEIDSTQTGLNNSGLSIDRKSMNEVAVIIYQQFGYDLKFSDPSLGDLIVSGSFENTSAQTVTQALCMSLNLRFSIDQNTITISR